MNSLRILLILTVALGVHTVSAQNDDLNMELIVTDEEKIVLFSGFAIAVLGIFLFLARDIILRRKTSYDEAELESKKDKTYEKYHSDWNDDYEEFGNRRNTRDDREFREALNDNELPNYYEVIGVSPDASADEIKKQFRERAKRTHPDRSGEDSEEEMARLNKAYEVLSDAGRRKTYDRYLRTD